MTRVSTSLLRVGALLLLCTAVFAGGPAVAADKMFSAAEPAGWRRLDGGTKASDRAMWTRDGVLVNSIRVTVYELRKPLPESKRALNSEMLPEELAEAAIVEIRAEKGSQARVEVLQRAPVQLMGQTGFRVQLGIHADPGAAWKGSYVGCVLGDRFYLLAYEALSRHYFDRDVAVFDEFLRSFRPAP